MLQVLVTISQKFYCKKRLGYAKVLKKMDTDVQDIANNGYLDARLKKEREMNKIAPAL